MSCQAREGKTVRTPLFRPEDVERVMRESEARNRRNEQREHALRLQARSREPAPADPIARGLALMHEPDWSTQTASEHVVRQLFSDLVFLERIGRGGMGSVFRAQRPDGTMVAAKVLPREIRRHPEFAARIALEVDLLRRLDHPGIVRLIEHREHDGVLCFVMELIEGTSLLEHLERGAIARERAFSIALALLDALAHAHARGVIHRDIKPSNVMLDRDDRPRLLDFGIGRLLHRDPHDALTDPREVVGSKGYIAPEALAGREADARADLFAVGVLVHEMLTGERALWSIAREPAPAIEPALDAVLARALAPDPAHRFANAHAMMQALRDVAMLARDGGR